MPEQKQIIDLSEIQNIARNAFDIAQLNEFIATISANNNFSANITNLINVLTTDALRGNMTSQFKDLTESLICIINSAHFIELGQFGQFFLQLNKNLSDTLLESVPCLDAFMPAYFESINEYSSTTLEWDTPLTNKEKELYNEAYKFAETLFDASKNQSSQSRKFSDYLPLCETPLAKNIMYVIVLIYSIVYIMNGFSSTPEININFNFSNYGVTKIDEQK